MPKFTSQPAAAAGLASLLLMLGGRPDLAQTPPPAAKDVDTARRAAVSSAQPREVEPSRALAGPDLNDVLSGEVGPPVGADYVKRVEMIPMRDGVRLYTVITLPKGAHDAPMILTRTPYDAAKRAHEMDSPSMLSTLPLADDGFVRHGYIRVFQDVRGKYGSEGSYVMTRPPRGPLNPTGTDDTTDAYDTIDWLTKHVPEANGRVGMLGSSYEGWTVVMALLGPHPALKVAAPESPMVDGWMGDDWFHYGAYRQPNLDYISEQTARRGDGAAAPRSEADDYAEFLRAGSVHAYAVSHGLDRYPWEQRTEAHPAYDGFWSGQALDRLVAEHPSHVPTLWEQGLWDQEDMWGAIHSWTALTKAGYGATNYLVMGPWRHSGVNHDSGAALGPVQFGGDTAVEWRHDVLLPVFNRYLKPGAPKFEPPHALIYNTGENHWDRLNHWPLACERGCDAPLTPLYLEPGFSLSFQAPAGGADAYDAYVSDPAKPVPYLPRPVRFADAARWQTWLVSDQRSVDGRPDVLTYATPALTSPVRISGATIADIYAATSGTDGDWVVKLIDVYPGQTPFRPEMGGYELPIAMDIFRGRYRDGFDHAVAAKPGEVERYRFALPTANHVFQPGHRIMVQIQSSWFPLYDRNPQSFVPNIFKAGASDYQAATQKVYRAGATASALWLPVVAAAH